MIENSETSFDNDATLVTKLFNNAKESISNNRRVETDRNYINSADNKSSYGDMHDTMHRNSNDSKDAADYKYIEG